MWPRGGACGLGAAVEFTANVFALAHTALILGTHPNSRQGMRMDADIGSHVGAVVGTAIGVGVGAAVGHDTGAAVVCGSGATLAEVLRRFGPAWRARHAVSTQQARVWRAIQEIGRAHV